MTEITKKNIFSLILGVVILGVVFKCQFQRLLDLHGSTHIHSNIYSTRTICTHVTVAQFTVSQIGSDFELVFEYKVENL